VTNTNSSKPDAVSDVTLLKSSGKPIADRMLLEIVNERFATVVSRVSLGSDPEPRNGWNVYRIVVETMRNNDLLIVRLLSLIALSCD